MSNQEASRSRHAGRVGEDMSTTIVLPTATVELLARKALEIVVNSPASLTEARTNLDEIDAAQKALKSTADALKRPLQDFINEVNVKVKPLETLLKDRRAELASKIVAYVDWCAEEARKQQAKELLKYERRVDRLEANAEATGAPVPIVPPPPVIAPPPKTVETDTGKQTIMVTRDWRLPTVVSNGQAIALDKYALSYQDALDCKLAIPAAYFFLDPGKIGQIVRAGGHVPGIEVVEVKGIAVKKAG